MLSSCKIRDPLPRSEAPLTPDMIMIMKKESTSMRDCFIVTLNTGAFFFALRSCEHVKTPGNPRT